MPNRHRNRFTKGFGHKSTSGMLVTSEDIKSGNPGVFQHDRENIVLRMDTGARLEAQSMIRERYDIASPQTDAMKTKMVNLDLQYRSLFQDDMGDEEERFFLPKSREDADIIYAFILDTVTQLRPLVSMQPKLTTLMNATEDFKKAKVSEALIQFYFNDVWKIVDNQFPMWLKHFLKYPQAIYKISYKETNYNPDLILSVVDRALLYLDPDQKRIQDCQWIHEREFMSKHEVMENVNRGDWLIPSDDVNSFEGNMTIGNTTDDELSRFMGTQNHQQSTIEADELVEVFHYWQYPRKGLDDLYAVIVGGIEGSLVRYGRNFNPYKGNQYIGSSYNQDDRPDGTSLVEQIRPHQKIINSWVNLRNDDVLENVKSTSFVDRDLIDAETQESINNGDRWVGAAPEIAQAIRNGGGKLQDAFFTPQSGTSTGELLTHDLPFILGQAQESSHLSDVFRGGAPPPGTPLGIVQEQLTRNAGAFKPVIRQVMLPFERMAEIMLEYHKSEDLFPEERVISIIGKNHYADVIPEWQNIGGGTQALAVEPDMMDVDVKFNAVSGADAFAAKTILNSTIAALLQGLGQNPELLGIIRKDFNFSALWSHLLNVSGLDIDKLQYTDQEKEQNEQKEQAQQQQAQQQQQQQMQVQLQMQEQLKQIELQSKVIEETLKSELKQKSQIAIDESKISAQTDMNIETTIARIVQEELAKAKLSAQDHEQTKEEMRVEGQIEKDNQVTNVNPSGGGNIQTKQGS